MEQLVLIYRKWILTKININLVPMYRKNIYIYFLFGHNQNSQNIRSKEYRQMIIIHVFKFLLLSFPACMLRLPYELDITHIKNKKAAMVYFMAARAPW